MTDNQQEKTEKISLPNGEELDITIKLQPQQPQQFQEPIPMAQPQMQQSFQQPQQFQQSFQQPQQFQQAMPTPQPQIPQSFQQPQMPQLPQSYPMVNNPMMPDIPQTAGAMSFAIPEKSTAAIKIILFLLLAIGVVMFFVYKQTTTGGGQAMIKQADGTEVATPQVDEKTDGTTSDKTDKTSQQKTAPNSTIPGSTTPSPTIPSEGKTSVVSVPPIQLAAPATIEQLQAEQLQFQTVKKISR